EAARKENASAIVQLFSAQAGKFVCATAGHHLESLLAAHGSGAVALSRDAATPVVLNVDIGGGTTKLAVCRSARVEETAAIDVGARLLSWAGGVGEYINGWEKREFGDLGLRLGRAIARRLESFEVLRPVESIRATCIGASQYSVQVSGDTLFLTDPGLLPLRDLAAVAVRP